MENDLLRLDSVLSLMVEEGSGVVILRSEWDKGSGGFRLTLVGRLLSHRSVHFDALKVSLTNILHPAKGVVVRKVSESRFCLIFNHFEDLRRVLDLRPWIFDRSLVVIQPLSSMVDPLTVDLDWCPFFVHVHDIPYSQRTVAVVRYIGNCLGAWLEEVDIARFISWFETVRIRININVTKPLKRALRLRLEQGDEVVVRFFYERLPNFCYLCGKLGHIGQYCDLRFQEHFVDPGSQTPYGAWLRASGPDPRIGSGSVPARPTYIWHGSSSSGLLGSGLQGAHIFGDFLRGSVRWEAVIEKVPVGGSPHQEWLEEVKKRLAIQQGKEKINLSRRLMDERSDSTGPPFLNQVHPGPVINMGRQAHLRGAHSSSKDSVGTSLGPIEVIPDSVVSPRPNSISAAAEKLTDPHLKSLDLFTVELGLGISGHRSRSSVWPLSLPVNEAYVPGGDAAMSLLPLVDVPLDSSFSIAGVVPSGAWRRSGSWWVDSS
ncbi:hypothetical protein Salat_2672000 [Sesamum alatum]|uniref:CCHC-type domain-containing protein n=1 Tax=Sesamum alatum TaxID=300844 RepID=A0AAE1XPL8_9LAMI|nr:hypothetical protein Salat_2672000 [Sesamum alatum]